MGENSDNVDDTARQQVINHELQIGRGRYGGGYSCYCERGQYEDKCCHDNNRNNDSQYKFSSAACGKEVARDENCENSRLADDHHVRSSATFVQLNKRGNKAELTVSDTIATTFGRRYVHSTTAWRHAGIIGTTVPRQPSQK
jgi:hypothetical protein